MNLRRWQLLMQSLDLPDSQDTFAALDAAYKEPHRHYHTGQHIADSLQQFDLLRGQALQPYAIELALWFHDAVYQPYRTGNERKSADWAAQFLQDAGAEPALVERVRGLIMATEHQAIAEDRDTSLLIDVDLAILGATSDRYTAFEQDIRHEYRWVPYFLYRQKRKEILASFLRRRRIYSSDLFHAHYEARARDNMQMAIGSLK